MRYVLFVLVLAAIFNSPVWSDGCLAEEMQYPVAVTASQDGPLFIADRNVPGIWKFADGKLKLHFEGSKQFRTPLNAVRCVTIDHKGRLLAGDSATRQVYRFDKTGKPQPLASNEVGIGIPMDLAVDSKGTIYVADLEVHRIWKLPPQGGQPEEVAQIRAPRGLAVDDQDRLWIVAHRQDQLVRLTSDGNLETVVEGRPFRFPHQVVVTAKNVAYVSDGYAQAIWKIDGSGEPEKWVSGKPLQNPVGLGRQDKTLLIADPHAKAVFSLDSEGQLNQLVPPQDSR